MRTVKLNMRENISWTPSMASPVKRGKEAREASKGEQEGVDRGREKKG